MIRLMNYRTPNPVNTRPTTNTPSNGEKVSKKIAQQWTHLYRVSL